MGADALIDAAAALFGEADLADLLSFLTFTAVADRAGVRPATVQHHFKRRSAEGKPNERLARATVLGIIGAHQERATEGVEQATDAAGGLDARPDATLRSLRQISAQTLAEYLENEDVNRAFLILSAVSSTDPSAASIVRDWYEQFTDTVVPVYEGLVDAFDRRFEDEAGFDARSFAVMITALTDGLIQRHQFEPEAVDPWRYAELVLRLFEAATVPQDIATAHAVDERLLGMRDRPPTLPVGSGLDADKHAGMVAAVVKLYDEGGLGALSVSAVAREAEVSRSTVVNHFGDVSGMATTVWAHFLPDLERRIQRDHDRGRAPMGVIERHFQRVAERVQLHPQLSALGLEASVRVRAQQRVSGIDPADLRTVAPLPHMVVPVIVANAELFRPGFDDAEAAFDLAAALTDLTVLNALSHPTWTPIEVADHAMDLLIDGVRRR